MILNTQEERILWKYAAVRHNIDTADCIIEAFRKRTASIWQDQVKAMVGAGRLVDGVKLVREKTNLPLREALEYARVLQNA